MHLCTLQLHGQYDVIIQFMKFLYTPNVNKVWGIVGPDDNPGVTSFIAPMSVNAGLMTVSLLRNTCIYMLHVVS